MTWTRFKKAGGERLSHMEETIISLATLNGGAAVEAFDAELRKLVQNIADFNTLARERRSITLKVTFQPSDDRLMGGVKMSCTSKPAPRDESKPGAPRMVRGGDANVEPSGHFEIFSMDDLSAVNETMGTPMRRVGKKNAGALLDGREWKEFPCSAT